MRSSLCAGAMSGGLLAEFIALMHKITTFV